MYKTIDLIRLMKNNYVPPQNFQKLANAFIRYNSPALSISEIQELNKIFIEFNINLKN